MRLIYADELIKGRVENDLVRIAAECAPTAYDIDKVINKLEEYSFGDPYGNNLVDLRDAIEIVKKGGSE